MCFEFGVGLRCFLVRDRTSKTWSDVSLEFRYRVLANGRTAKSTRRDGSRW